MFLLCLIIFSDTAVKSASKGIELWLNIVFPSLFPFFVGSELLNKTGLVKTAGTLLEPVMRPIFNVPGCGSFPFAMGITSGYPIGAKITADMRGQELITKTEAERLLAFTNNSGPLFIMGAVSVGMYNMPQIGILLLLCHVLSCITVGAAFRFYKRHDKSRSKKIKPSVKSLKANTQDIRKTSLGNVGSLLGDAVKSSVQSMLAIGGFIILFSVIISLLMETGIIATLTDIIYSIASPLGADKDIIKSALCGFFEITTGANIASKSQSASLVQQLTVTSIIIGWAGLSVHSQVISIISNTDISAVPYLLGKLVQGIVSGIYTYACMKIAGHSLMRAEPAFSAPDILGCPTWQYYLGSSCKYLVISIAVLLAFTAVVRVLPPIYRKFNLNHKNL
ncbi:sporulation integral membrane protein YlbJ [Anaerobacterium chartisolvens]|nr:sporulation integral membrane protein YlbJ [Anaerobacterium chartisolvens]